MNPIAQTLTNLQAKVMGAVALPADLKQKALEQIARSTLSLQYGGNLSALEITEKYIEFICKLPWQTVSQDRLDISIVKQILNQKHYGLEKIKKRIEEYLASVIMIKKQNPNALLRAPSLFFTGLAGTGKTSFAPMIADLINATS